MLAAVATDDPEMAAKTPQEPTAASAMPPRQPPHRARVPANRSADRRAFDARTPIRMNMGMGLKA